MFTSSLTYFETVLAGSIAHEQGVGCETSVFARVIFQRHVPRETAHPYAPKAFNRHSNEAKTSPKTPLATLAPVGWLVHGFKRFLIESDWKDGAQQVAGQVQQLVEAPLRMASLSVANSVVCTWFLPGLFENWADSPVDRFLLQEQSIVSVKDTCRMLIRSSFIWGNPTFPFHNQTRLSLTG